MRFSRAGAARIGCALVVGAALPVAAVAPVGAADPRTRTYEGPSYSSELAVLPTATETQAKLWFSDGSWWALMVDPTSPTTRVHQLMPDHTWRPTSAVVNGATGNVGDVYFDGGTAHAVTRTSDGALLYVRLTFDPAIGEYRAAPASLVTSRGGQSPSSIVEDAVGTLWVGYATASGVFVTHSTDGGATWADVRLLAATGTGATQEVAALVAYDDQVGILWSDQAAEAFWFGSHRAGDPPTAWAVGQAVAGDALADNHISLVNVPGDPSDTLVAAVKTSRGDQGEPVESALIEVLVRAPDGSWSSTPVSTIADELDDPVLQVDVATGTLHLFASARGDIVTKRAPLDDIAFEPGVGQVAVIGASGDVVEPTTTRNPVDARSGLVVLASDYPRASYRHAEMALAPPSPPADLAADQTPPAAPHDLRAAAVSPEEVVLSWAASTETDRWAPASDGVPAQEYVISRNGVEVATVSSTSTRDLPGTDVSGTTVRYEVVAVDMAGNRSPAADVVVDVPESGVSNDGLLGMALLALAGGIGGYALWRTRARRG